MIKYINECVNCHEKMGCIGDACPNRNVPVHYCDCCGTYADKTYKFDCNEAEYCIDCMVEFAENDFNEMNKLEKIECIFGDDLREVE